MKKSNLMFIIILIFIIILSCILGTIQIVKKMKEGMENNEDVPPCYSTIHDDYAPFHPDEDNKYILKTKIVPPKGTACPTDISSSALNYLNDKKETNVTAMSSSNSSNSTNTSNTNTTITSNVPASAPEPIPSPSTSPSSVTNDSHYGSEINNQINQPKSDQCPPCPACERCPEPSFECKKVPNYRSPSINQYLPMPILNDFSKF
jgi:hypothetical protein